jgi:hypothetical protein
MNITHRLLRRKAIPDAITPEDKKSIIWQQFKYLHVWFRGNNLKVMCYHLGPSQCTESSKHLTLHRYILVLLVLEIAQRSREIEVAVDAAHLVHKPSSLKHSILLAILDV